MTTITAELMGDPKPGRSALDRMPKADPVVPSDLQNNTADMLAWSAKARSDSKTGFRGVQRHIETGRYQARIRKDGRRVNLGSYDTPEKAYAAYVAANTQS